MKPNQEIQISLLEEFDPANYAAVSHEIEMINERTYTFPSRFKTEILVSFLKNHSLQIIWIAANPQLAEWVTSGAPFTGSIESLFHSSRENQVFQGGLETYLNIKFKRNISPQEIVD